MKRYPLLILLLLNALTLSAQSKCAFEWPNGEDAAVVLTYDDGLDCHLDVAMPALNGYGFKGTFYCTGNSFSLQNRMDEWRAMAANGHELGNHSLFHPCDGERFDWVPPVYDLNTYTIKQISDELFTANSLLKAVDGKSERTYGYTCSDYKAGGESFIDEVRRLFVSARSGGAIPSDMTTVDLHFMPSWGVNDPTGKELINYVKEAQSKGTIAVFMFHSVGGGYLNVSAEAHEELLKYLSANKNLIWTDTFLNVTKYISENRTQH